MKLEFSRAAKLELFDAQARYEAAREGLGLQFVEEMQALAKKAATMPERFPLMKGTALRRALGKRFPYMIVFKVRGALVRILAVAHQRQEPGYWSGRS